MVHSPLRTRRGRSSHEKSPHREALTSPRRSSRLNSPKPVETFNNILSPRTSSRLRRLRSNVTDDSTPDEQVENKSIERKKSNKDIESSFRNETAKEIELPVKRKRGRPRKYPVNVEQPVSSKEKAKEQDLVVGNSTPITRKRGRPRKYPRPEVVEEKEEDNKTPVKRGRGRPPKRRMSPNSTVKLSPTTSPALKRRRTRSSVGELDTIVNSTDKSKVPIRKSSRTPRKRSLDIKEDVTSRRSPRPIRNSLDGQRNFDSMNSTLPFRALDPMWRTHLLLELQRRVRRKVDPYGFFSKPVDPEEDECPDYYDIVDKKQTMCFDQIHDMIEKGKIKNVAQFQKCLDRIVLCARLYNTDEDNFVRKQADLIEERSEPIIKSIIEKWGEKEEREKNELKEKKNAELLHRQKMTRANRSQSISSSYSEDSRASRAGRGRGRPRRGRKSSRDKLKTRPKRQRANNVKYADDEDSAGHISESDFLPQNPDEDEDDVSIEGIDIPFCKPMLVGSTMTPCDTRDEWLKICHEMSVVCNEAARRSTLRSDPNARRYEKPLSEIYMKERLEYDDPLEGFVVRTKSEPHHLQGFILVTRFTTWRRTFRFVSSDDPAALITPTDHRLHLTDKDGQLTKELQECEKDDSVPNEGFKYPRICEISLLGGLGCGGALLSRALSELRQSRKYDYVVLQSTKMAIPFYERHGFVRVGAVTRFNDVEQLPEVAYRHWSEIVNGEAVEPSYMMARRLKTSREQKPTTPLEAVANGDVDHNDRLLEIESALKSVHSLLSDALTIRIGSAAYTNSFREILSAAREFAISADDYNLVKMIDKSLSEFTGSHFGKSKRLLRSELRHCNSSRFFDDEDIHDDEEMSDHPIDSAVLEEPEEKILVSTSVVVDNVPFGPDSVEDEGNLVEEKKNESLKSESDLDLIAELPATIMENDNFFNVDIVGEGVDFEHGLAKAILPSSLKPSRDLQEAQSLAVENLTSFLCKRSKHSERQEEQVAIGDEIMLKIEKKSRTAIWVDAKVTRRAYMKDDTPNYTGHNAFRVEWDDDDKTRKESRILDKNNRGIGKEWCTEIDFASFSVLPLSVLDSLLIGSQVKYAHENGKIVEGIITQRVGQGVELEPKFVIEIGREKKRGRPTKSEEDYATIKLSAGAIREGVTISESNYATTRRLLRSNKFAHLNQSAKLPVTEDGDGAEQKKNLKETKKSEALDAQSWAKHRIEKLKLANISDEEKKNRKKNCKKIDELIIRLPTGIGRQQNQEQKVDKEDEPVEEVKPQEPRRSSRLKK